MTSERRVWCVYCSSTELEHRSDGSGDMVCKSCGKVYELKAKPEPAPVESNMDVGSEIKGGGAA